MQIYLHFYLRSFVRICKILEFPVCNLSHQLYSVITAKNNKSVTKKKKDKSIFNEPSMPLSWYYCHKSLTDIFKQFFFLCYIKVDGWFSVVVSKLAGKSTWLQELWWELCFHDISQWWVYQNMIPFHWNTYTEQVVSPRDSTQAILSQLSLQF